MVEARLLFFLEIASARECGENKRTAKFSVRVRISVSPQYSIVGATQNPHHRRQNRVARKAPGKASVGRRGHLGHPSRGEEVSFAPEGKIPTEETKCHGALKKASRRPDWCPRALCQREKNTNLGKYLRGGKRDAVS